MPAPDRCRVGRQLARHHLLGQLGMVALEAAQRVGGTTIVRGGTLSTPPLCWLVPCSAAAPTSRRISSATTTNWCCRKAQQRVRGPAAE